MDSYQTFHILRMLFGCEGRRTVDQAHMYGSRSSLPDIVYVNVYT